MGLGVGVGLGLGLGRLGGGAYGDWVAPEAFRALVRGCGLGFGVGGLGIRV